MDKDLNKILVNRFNAKEAIKQDVIQSLWSGYGEIVRYQLIGSDISSVIVKHINLTNQTNHPRGWNTNNSHLRKVKSYQVEQEWYQHWAKRCDDSCKVPTCFESIKQGEEQLIILEDLDASGYSERKSFLNKSEVVLGLKWLANFHATFLNEFPSQLWQEGSYWHLATRPDELKAMNEGRLKEAAVKIDQVLSDCQFKTIIHGDAKVANFCFSQDMKHIAAVDFQYVGGGCGMKDITYFLGSCLSENECEKYEADFLDIYFAELKEALQKRNKKIDFQSLEHEWRNMYSVAWADFTRFLLGWMPSHQKVNGYSLKMVEEALSYLKR